MTGGLRAQGAGLRVVIAGGGTGGHVIPALAIARELRDVDGAEVLFLGTARGLETRLVPEAGFGLELIRVGQLNSVSLATKVRTLADLPVGVAGCVGLLRRFGPDVVVGVGGYASGPGMLAAILLRVPTLAFEPNGVPGMANRLVGRLVSAAAVNFEETRRYFRGGVVTGIPVRREFFEVADRTGGDGLKLLVFGGSQGARALNDGVPLVASTLMRRFPALRVLHQTGLRDEGRTRALYAATGVDASRWEVQAYLDDMPRRFAEADLLLCRSGASTMAELGAAGKAALLIPFPRAADDHQRKNAEAYARVAAAAVMLEAEMTAERLEAALAGMLADPKGLREMGERSRGFARPNAAAEIAGMVRKLAQG